jgi:glycosyltransferase involved in cell wall biosynthesis
MFAMTDLFKNGESEKISVIMPVYNGAKFMKNTITQIKAQTFSGFKCYLIDDYSSDNSVKIMEKEISGDARFVLIKNQQNLGKPKTLNKGLELARGEYVLMLDDDDEYLPTMFEDLYQRARKDDLDVAICNLEHYDLDEGIYGNDVLDFSKIKQDEVYSVETLPKDVFILKLTYSTLWNKLFKLELVQKIGLEFEDFFPADDTLFTLKALCAAKKIGFIKKTLIVWKINDPNSGMGALARNDGYKNVIKIYDEMEKVLRQNGIWQNWKSSYASYPVELSGGLLLDSMRGTQLARDLFDKTKKYTSKFSQKDILKGDIIARIFVKSDDYDSFVARYDKLIFIEAQNIIAYNEALIAKQQDDIVAILDSNSYKIGKLVTAPARVLRRIISSKNNNNDD